LKGPLIAGPFDGRVDLSIRKETASNYQKEERGDAVFPPKSVGKCEQSQERGEADIGGEKGPKHA